MSSKKLVICDRETEYASRLADHLGAKKELALQVRIVSGPEQVAGIQRESGIDILLADEQTVPEEDALSGIPHILWLTGKPVSETERSGRKIFRYQSGEEICTCLIEALAENGGGDLWNVRRKERGKMIGVYSPVHRLGQTAFALKKGKELARTKNVLYLNLEAFAGIGGHFPEEKRNLSMLLYYAKQESGNPGLLITTLVKQMEGLDYIPPVLFPEDLKTVTEGEWLWLLGEIMDHSLYDVLILDLGDCIQGLFEILKHCDTVYLPAANDRLAVSKLYQYEEVLCRQGYGEVWERMVRCDIRRTVKDKNTGRA